MHEHKALKVDRKGRFKYECQLRSCGSGLDFDYYWKWLWPWQRNKELWQ